mgnify:FL=1
MSDVNDTAPDDEMLAAEMVLGLASEQDTAAARQRMASDAAFSTKVVFWYERMTALTDDIDPVKPPARVKKKLFAQVFARQKVSILQRVWLWQGVAMASLLFAGYLGVQLLKVTTHPDIPPPVLAAQLDGDSSPLRVLAVLEPVKNEIALRRVAGEPVPNRSFELWAILPDQAPVSLGVLPDSETTRVAIPPSWRDQTAQMTLAISDEPIGGSPTGAPTGDVLAIGAMTNL